ncbi:MAG: hypothetical protein KKA73_14890, partial [Chloroflexi bacterium]|nr:hypothetical protein [Chloroflexota bacterium]
SAPVVDRRRPGGYILAPPPTCPTCDRPMETTAGAPWPTHWIGHQPPHWHPVHSLTPRPLFPEVAPMPITDDHISQMLAAHYLGRAALDPLAPVIKVEQWQPALLPIVWDILGIPAHQREQATQMLDHELNAAADLEGLLARLRTAYHVASPPLPDSSLVAARLLSILGRLRHQMTAYPAVNVEMLLPSLMMMTVTVIQLLDLDLQTDRLMEMVDLLLAYRDRFAPDDTPTEWLAALPQIKAEWHARAQLLTQLEGPADGAPADGAPDLTPELDDLLELPSPALRYSIRVLLQGATGDEPWWRFDTGLEIRDALVEAWIGRRQHDGRARPFACFPISPGWLVALALDEVQALHALWDAPGIASPDDVHAPLVGTTVEFYMRDGQQRDVQTLTGLDVLALFRQLAAAADRSGVVRLTDGEGEEILIAISEIQLVMATIGWIVYGRVDLPEDEDEYYDMQP